MALEVVEPERRANDNSTTSLAISRAVEPPEGRALVVPEPDRTTARHAVVAGMVLRPCLFRLFMLSFPAGARCRNPGKRAVTNTGPDNKWGSATLCTTLSRPSVSSWWRDAVRIPASTDLNPTAYRPCIPGLVCRSDRSYEPGKPAGTLSRGPRPARRARFPAGSARLDRETEKAANTQFEVGLWQPARKGNPVVQGAGRGKSSRAPCSLGH